MKYELLEKGDVIVKGTMVSYQDRWRFVHPSKFGTIHHGEDVAIRPIQTWQDITTAPKDGTAILVGWWTDRHGCPRDWNAVVVAGYDERHGWELVESGSYADDPFFNGEPTHWMPLPDAPIKEEGV